MCFPLLKVKIIAIKAIIFVLMRFLTVKFDVLPFKDEIKT